MIIIESYILKPAHVRGGENILNPITSYGGYKSNITINNDGSGTIVYNNSDYIVSVSNDLIVGSTSYFTISNVVNTDTVELYEDSVLISTTTGNTVAYTPTTAGVHSIYLRVNNASTQAFEVNVYTLTSTTINIPTYDGVAYFPIILREFTFTVKPNLLEDVTLNNIPCTITYGSNTYNFVVTTRGTQISIPALLNSSSNTNTLTINCAGDVSTYAMQEHYSAFKQTLTNYYMYLNYVRADEGISTLVASDNTLRYINNSDSVKYVKFAGEYFSSAFENNRLFLEIANNYSGIAISNSNKEHSVGLIGPEVVVTSTKHDNFYVNAVYQNGELLNGMNSDKEWIYLKIPQNTTVVIKNLVYGVL